MFESYKRATNAIVSFVNRAGLGNKRAATVLVSVEVKKRFLGAVHHLGQRSLVLGSFSEISTRVGNSWMLAVGAGSSFTDAQEEDLAILDLKTDTEYTDVPAPRHVSIHKLVYSETQHQVVLLSHPRYAIQLLNQHLQPDFSTLPAAQELIGQFTTCSLENLSTALHASNIILVEGIGLLSLGTGLQQVVDRVEALDWISWMSMQNRL